MATCSVDKISVVCEGGCGLICTSSQCWSWCEPVPNPVVVPAVMLFRSDEATAADQVIPGSAEVRLCANSATRRSLVHVLEMITGQRLIPDAETDTDDTDTETETSVQPFTGTLDELLTHHRLRRDDSPAATGTASDSS
jgi:hypothetical protein